MITEVDKILSNCRKFLNGNNDQRELLQKAAGKVTEKELNIIQSSISKVSAFEIAEVLGVALCDTNILPRIVNAVDIGYQKPAQMVYDLALKNCARQITVDAELKRQLLKMRSENRKKEVRSMIAGHDAFDIAQILAICFMKSSEDVVLDLVNVEIVNYEM